MMLEDLIRMFLAQILNKYSYSVSLFKRKILQNFIQSVLNANIHHDICKAQKLTLKFKYGQKMFGMKSKDISTTWQT